MQTWRLQNVSEDRLAIFRRHTASLMTSSENSLPIPTDLVMEIFSRLPAKSVGRCHCVSKSWACLLRRPDFTELFLTTSYARPQLLFSCIKDKTLFFFSSDQPQNPDKKSSLIVTYLSHVPNTYKTCGPINGLVCLRGTRIFKGGKTQSFGLVLCNPTTGETFILPKMNRKRRMFTVVMSSLGYDPTEKQYKVFFMTLPMAYKYCQEYQVLTLGTEELPLWREMECSIPHRPRQRKEICVNGVLYYQAVVLGESLAVTMLVCFDFRTEQFSYMNVMETFNRTVLPRTTTLINYGGKLGVLMTEESTYTINGRSKCFELWILEDTVKHEWSKRRYVLPPLWNRTLIGKTKLYFVGMVGTNEIVLSFDSNDEHAYVLYYNTERNTIRGVRIRGMETFKGNAACRIFLNHVENVKLLQTL